MIDAKKIGLVGGGILLLLIAGITLTNNPAGSGGNRVASVFVPDSGPFVGSRAPDFKLKGTNGTVISLSDFQGKVVIVNFWATWCAPCREEIPGFVKLQERYRDDVVIVGISMDQDGPRVVPPFVEKFGINYPVVYGNSKVSRDYGGISGIPTTFVLGRDLVVQRVYVGYRPEFQFDQDIKALI